MYFLLECHDAIGHHPIDLSQIVMPRLFKRAYMVVHHFFIFPDSRPGLRFPWSALTQFGSGLPDQR